MVILVFRPAHVVVTAVAFSCLNLSNVTFRVVQKKLCRRDYYKCSRYGVALKRAKKALSNGKKYIDQGLRSHVGVVISWSCGGR